MNEAPEPGHRTPRIEYRESFLVAGTCERYSFASTDGIPDQWRRFWVVAADTPGRIGSRRYGVMLPVPGVADGFDYLSGVKVAGIAGLPGALGHACIPAGPYAVFEHHGHVSGIKAAWQAVCDRWLPDAGLEIAEASILFEQYGADFDPESAESVVTLWVPVNHNPLSEEKTP